MKEESTQDEKQAVVLSRGPVVLRDTALISRFAVGEFGFHLVPEGFNDLAGAWATTGEMGLSGDGGNIVMTQLRVMNRIVKWDGPIQLEDGSTAPCTKANKNSFFGQRPDILMDLAEMVYRKQNDDLKNS